MKDHNEPRFTPAALAALARGEHDNFLTAATPGGIEAQEKAGQTTFVASATLPRDMQRCTRADFEKMGFKFGEDVDKIFVSVTLPDGWKKIATDHSMWSDLIDDKGRKRAGIFYKAAFYDRNAHISLDPRYKYSSYIGVNERGEPIEPRPTHYAVAVTDCGKEIHRIGIYQKDDYKACDVLEKEARSWLDEKYPHHKDATAYWD